MRMTTPPENYSRDFSGTKRATWTGWKPRSIKSKSWATSVISANRFATVQNSSNGHFRSNGLPLIPRRPAREIPQQSPDGEGYSGPHQDGATEGGYHGSGLARHAARLTGVREPKP